MDGTDGGCGETLGPALLLPFPWMWHCRIGALWLGGTHGLRMRKIKGLDQASLHYYSRYCSSSFLLNLLKFVSSSSELQTMYMSGQMENI
jgi:hypothetical protein